ncbi:MAG: hypothetical protein ACRENP_09580 [Longimicrobiales bacterium]
MSTVARTAELDNARLGVIFFLGNLRVDLSPESSLTDLKNQGMKFLKSKIGDKASAELELVGRGVEAIDSTVDKIAAAIKTWLCERFKISETDAELAVQHLRHNLPGLISGINGEIGKEAADFTTGGLSTVATGLYTAITRTIEYFDLKHKGAGVALESGHPDLIASALTRGVARSALVGLAEAAVAGAKAALAAFTSGAGLIINKIAGVIEMILRFAVRFCEARTLAKLFATAKEYWLKKDGSSAIHSQASEFASWFKGAIERSPVVGSLVMNCGIAGDAMRFLQVCTAEGVIVTQGQFDKGVSYLNALKATASSFILEYQKQVRISSQDPMVASLLKHASQIGLVQKEASSSWRAQLWAWSNSGSTKSKALNWVLNKAGLKQSAAFAMK